MELLATDAASADLDGDLKSFYVGVWPYEHPLLPGDPYAQALLDARLELEGRVGSWLRISLHDVVTTTAGVTADSFGPSAAAGAETQPQAIDLSWDLVSGDGMRVAMRLDRAAVTLGLPVVEITLGRQPVSFGSTFFFNPMDLVAPFSPVVIDREYKPGIDAARLDSYFGTSGKVSVVAAYAGGWALDELILAAHAGITVDVVDLGAFFGLVRGDRVVGLDAVGDLAGMALRGEATVTVPDRGDLFVRAALGADYRFDCGLSLTGELYVQTLGAARPAGYAEVMASERYRRGEIWAVGRYYAALSASYELLPILKLGLFGVLNAADPSGLIGPSLTWSVADEVEVVAGGYFGAGERPAAPDPAALAELATGAAPVDPLDLLTARSEFGLLPAMGFLEMKVYF